MNKETIDRLVKLYGDRWMLRDLDFFPEKLSDMCRLYPYKADTFMNVIEGGFVSFATEKEALKASIQIYEKVLHKQVPYGLLHRYYLADSKK
jgi:hypothetical protein